MTDILVINIMLLLKQHPYKLRATKFQCDNPIQQQEPTSKSVNICIVN
jgi:hypothetical protein